MNTDKVYEMLTSNHKIFKSADIDFVVVVNGIRHEQCPVWKKLHFNYPNRNNFFQTA